MTQLRDSEFKNRKASLFDENDSDFEDCNYWDASVEEKLDIRRTVLRVYLDSRPNWYERLEQNTGKFNLETKAYIYKLIASKIRDDWKKKPGQRKPPKRPKRKAEVATSKYVYRELRPSPWQSEKERVCEGYFVSPQGTANR